MANDARNPNQFGPSGHSKFNLNLRTQGQICHGKKTHAVFAEIDAKSVQAGRLGYDLHRSIQQLAVLASPVGFEDGFEEHLYTDEDKVVQPMRTGTDYERSLVRLESPLPRQVRWNLFARPSPP